MRPAGRGAGRAESASVSTSCTIRPSSADRGCDRAGRRRCPGRNRARPRGAHPLPAAVDCASSMRSRSTAISPPCCASVERRSRFCCATRMPCGSTSRALARQRGATLRLVGNLPYNISTPLLFHLLQSCATSGSALDAAEGGGRPHGSRAGDPAYGRLTVMLSTLGGVEQLFDVGPGAFQPPPRVGRPSCGWWFEPDRHFRCCPAFPPSWPRPSRTGARRSAMRCGPRDRRADREQRGGSIRPAGDSFAEPSSMPSRAIVKLPTGAP